MKICSEFAIKATKRNIKGEKLHLGTNLLKFPHSSENLVSIASLRWKNHVNAGLKYKIFSKQKATKQFFLL